MSQVSHSNLVELQQLSYNRGPRCIMQRRANFLFCNSQTGSRCWYSNRPPAKGFKILSEQLLINGGECREGVSRCGVEPGRRLGGGAWTESWNVAEMWVLASPSFCVLSKTDIVMLTHTSAYTESHWGTIKYGTTPHRCPLMPGKDLLRAYGSF